MNRNQLSGNIGVSNVLVTGAGGFIGKAVCSRLVSGNKVIGVYHKKRPVAPANIVSEQADLTDSNAVAAICEKYSPDVVIHCAGIAHQKIGAVDLATYMRVNSEATENLAKAASKSNPDVCFIFLSSVSVYGEGPQITPVKYNKGGHLTPVRWFPPTGRAGQAQINTGGIPGLHPVEICPAFHRAGRFAQKEKNSNDGVREDSEFQPSSDYAFSKLDAERRLIALSDKGIIHDLIILRLAPVYDRDWSFNLDRRVLAPLNMAYMRFGSGLQKMSALARPNLVDFIEFLFHSLSRLTQITDKSIQQNNPCNERKLRINIFNVCDAEAYEFNKVIRAYKNSGIRPDRPVISVSLPVVRFAARIAGSLLPDKKKWIHSCYKKVSSSLVFDNEKMLKTGFKPVHSLETIFPSADSAD